MKFTAVELVADSKPAKPAAEKPTKPNRLGLVVSELPPAQRKALGIDYGLVVESADASRSPLRPGDVIVGVGRETIKSLEDFDRLIAEHKQGDTVALLVRRGEATVYVSRRSPAWRLFWLRTALLLSVLRRVAWRPYRQLRPLTE